MKNSQKNFEKALLLMFKQAVFLTIPYLLVCYHFLTSHAKSEHILLFRPLKRERKFAHWIVFKLFKSFLLVCHAKSVS